MRIEKNIFVSLKRTNETTTKIEEEETWRNAVQHAKAMGILSSELLFNVCVCVCALAMAVAAAQQLQFDWTLSERIENCVRNDT